MFLRLPLLSIYVLVNAARIEEERDLLDIALAGGADDLRDFIDFDHSDLSNHVNSNFIAMGKDRRKSRGGKGATSNKQSAGSGEQVNVSADEMQRGLLEFLKQHPDVGGLPEFHNPPKKYKTLLKKARAEANDWQSWKDPPSSCLKQLGGLLRELDSKCWKTMKRKMDKRKVRIRGVEVLRPHYSFNHFKDLEMPTCNENVEDLFLHGKDVVRAKRFGDDFAKDAPTATKPLLQTGMFLRTWIIDLATAKSAAILWAGFWTNASDPEGHQSRTSKERLFHFADRIESQTVHPSTALGRMAEENGNLAACEGPIENEVKSNMWSLFSFSFVYGMREKKQDMIVALVHKEMDGDRPLNESILFQYEVPAIGIGAWGLGHWSPQVVLIDLMGTCKQTSPALRKQLYSTLPGFYKHLAIEFEWSALDFSSLARVSWTCLDCPHSHCQLDERLAEQVKELLQASWHCETCFFMLGFDV
eukprot:s332_g46.t1